jgi:hypothetical protein
MRKQALVWYTRLRTQRGVGVAGSGVGLLNGQTTKQDPKLRWKGWVGLFVNTLRIRNRVAKCSWVMSRRRTGRIVKLNAVSLVDQQPRNNVSTN